MKKFPLVSVIITTYNRAKFLGDAIQSVLDQTYTNIEIIVVDDASTDETEKYIQNNWASHVTYVRHEKNLGVQYASNTGFEHAKGKYLAFTGDDDTWCDNDKIAKQVDLFEKDQEEKYGIVTTSICVVRPEGKKYNKLIKKPKNITKHILGRNGIVYGSAALLRRSAFLHAGKFVDKLPKGTDSDVYRRMILLGYDIFFLSDITVNYREGHPRMTSAADTSGILRSIKSEQYNLQKYASYLDIYRSSKALRLYKLGTLYDKMSRLKKNPNIKKMSRSCLLKSICCYPFQYKAYARLVLTYF